MPVYRIRKANSTSRVLAKNGGNAPDTAGIEYLPTAQSNASARTGGAGYVTVSGDGSTFSDLRDGVYGTKSSLTNGSANTLFTFPCASGVMASGVVDYCLEVSDGTDFQSISGMVTYSAVNKAGSVTAVVTEVAANQAKSVSAGTLVPAWTITNSSGTISVKVQPTSSLTPTTCRATFFVAPLVSPVTLA